MEARLSTLRGKAETARTLAYRMEVRLGVVLRLRTILATIAGREYLSRSGTPEERAAYQALLDCESLSLPLPQPVPGMRQADRPAFPPLEDDLAAAREVLPAWMGIRFGEVPAPARKAQQLTPGAVSVTAVYPESPAEEAALQVGDVVLGPPEAPFEDPRQIREWTMLATVDRPVPLEILRGDRRLEVTLVPRAYPVKWPELPGPPRVASPAPAFKPLQLAAYRGRLPDDLRNGTSHLLFFWATWCGPCKASVPEVLAFENERDTPVIAITDEPGETLDAFFRSFGKPFPERVATDEMRRAFLAYGVSGTPTFALVDGKGVIRSVSVGYSPNKGLGVEGWKWSGATAAAPAGQSDQ
jgi:thiol-disulfide isomerase/thioredoxin